MVRQETVLRPEFALPFRIDLPMWARTYKNGCTYYREHKNSGSQGICPSAGGSIPYHVADGQAGKLVEPIELGPQWIEEVLAIISLKDEVEPLLTWPREGTVERDEAPSERRFER